MKFAQRLRELRDAKGLSEARLATASGVSFSAIHEYGLGRRRPSFAAVVKIARALDVDCTAFADCEDITGGSPVEEPPVKKPATRKKPGGKGGKQ